ncbi:copper oxidase [Candidatus Binatia bacterium]|nr:copper oxidase [Candidatus Binatia bacterium]
MKKATRRTVLLSGAAAVGGSLVGVMAARAGAAEPAAPADPESTPSAPGAAGSTPPAPADAASPPPAPAGGGIKQTNLDWWEKSYSGGPLDVAPLPPGLPGKDYQPVVVPNGATLPFKIVDGAKVFHLVLGEIEHEFAPGLKTTCWAFNGQVAGLTIEAVEGERVRIYVTNRLPAETSVHWHGVYLPNGMDGVGGLNQPLIAPGETFLYEWTFRQHGTFMFHSHHDEMTQMAMGLTGMLVVHPRHPAPEQHVDRDFSILTGEFFVRVGTSRPNPIKDQGFNVLTMNGKVFPATWPLIVKTNDKVRIRFGNLSAMDHHPMHLHGVHFRVTATDGEQIPLSAQWPETTVLVAVGQTREIEFIADAPGDWALHCHMTHHVMNQMGHDFPNMLGVDADGLDRKITPLLPQYMTMGTSGMGDSMHMAVPPNSIPMMGGRGPFAFISMGGLVNVLKVRDRLDTYDEDPGWYEHPKGTVAGVAGAADLRRDGIEV